MPPHIILLGALAVGAALVAWSSLSHQQTTPNPDWASDDFADSTTVDTGIYADDSLALPSLSVSEVRGDLLVSMGPSQTLEGLQEEGKIAIAYLKSFVQYISKSGIYSGNVLQEALDDAKKKAFVFDIAKGLIKNSGDAANAALAVGGSAAIGSTLGAATGGALAVGAALVNLAIDEEGRKAQTRAANGMVTGFVRDYGLPPMALLNYLASVDGGDLPYELITGQGGYQRTREWGIGIIARYTKAILEIEQIYGKDAIEAIPYLNPIGYKKFAAQGLIAVPFRNNLKVLRPSRLAEWTRYAMHPASLFVVAISPTEKEWESQLQSQGMYYRSLSSFAALWGRNVTKGFVSSPGTMMRCMYGLPHYSTYTNKRNGIKTINPTALIFEIGHDPGFDSLPTPLLGLAGSNDVGVSFNPRNWLVKYTVPTNDSWLYTRE